MDILIFETGQVGIIDKIFRWLKEEIRTAGAKAYQACNKETPDDQGSNSKEKSDFRSRDFRGTPVGTRECIIDDYTLKDPLITGISAEWTENVIRKEAQKAGIREIYYMDIIKHSAFCRGYFSISSILSMATESCQSMQ